MNCYQSVQLVGLLTVWSSCWLCRAVGWSSVQIHYDSQSNYFLPPNRLFRCQRAHTIMTTTTICSFFYQHKPILKMNSTRIPPSSTGADDEFFSFEEIGKCSAYVSLLHPRRHACQTMWVTAVLHQTFPRLNSCASLAFIEMTFAAGEEIYSDAFLHENVKSVKFGIENKNCEIRGSWGWKLFYYSSA